MKLSNVSILRLSDLISALIANLGLIDLELRLDEGDGVGGQASNEGFGLLNSFAKRLG